MLRLTLFITFLSFVACNQDKTPSTPEQTQPNTALDVEPAVESVPYNNSQDERANWQQPEKVMGMFSDLSDKVIVDIGAGIGYFSVLLLPKAKNIIATEIDRGLVEALNIIKEQSKERFPGKLEVRLATENDTNLKAQEVDAILIVNTITYIPDRVAYLKDIKSKLRPGGEILIVDFKTKKFPDFMNAPEFEDRVYLHVIEEELEEAGFTWLRSDDTSLDYQYMVLATL